MNWPMFIPPATPEEDEAWSRLETAMRGDRRTRAVKKEEAERPAEGADKGPSEERPGEKGEEARRRREEENRKLDRKLMDEQGD